MFLKIHAQKVNSEKPKTFCREKLQQLLDEAPDQCFFGNSKNANQELLSSHCLLHNLLKKERAIALLHHSFKRRKKLSMYFLKIPSKALLFRL